MYGYAMAEMPKSIYQGSASRVSQATKSNAVDECGEQCNEAQVLSCVSSADTSRFIWRYRSSTRAKNETQRKRIADCERGVSSLYPRMTQRQRSLKRAPLPCRSSPTRKMRPAA